MPRDKEKERINNLNYRLSHKEELNEYHRKYEKSPSGIARRKKYYQNNREKILKQNKKYLENNRLQRSLHLQQYRENIKIKVLSHYSGNKIVCVRCGFDDIRALSIDHINGDGGRHRANTKQVKQGFYKWLISNNFPEGFQTLCMNCQWIKRYENKEFPQNGKINIGNRNKQQLNLL